MNFMKRLKGRNVKWFLRNQIKNKQKTMSRLDKIKTAFTRKGYKWFTNGKYNLNIVGVRNDLNGNGVSNEFDDKLYLSFTNSDGVLVFKEYDITTDPGKHWMNHPLNTDGTAILVPGQYRGSHMLGLHQGKYEALRQKNPVKVYRDNDRDNEYDTDVKSIQEGTFGINIHRSNPYSESYYVDKWSAGCQVFKSVHDFNEFMDICRDASKIWGNSFTYTLILESDLV